MKPVSYELVALSGTSEHGETNEPLVTVIATCYNHARFVVEALESIRCQTYPNIELIIADDCSTDDSAERIRAWVDEQGVECHLRLHDRNQGLCRTLNEALSLASGKYIALISTDDVWLPDKTARQVMIMEALPESVAVVYSDAYVINEDGERLPGRYIQSRVQRPDTPEGDVFHTLLRDWCFIPAMATLIRRSCLDAVGPYDESLVFEDVDMWLRLARRYRFAFDSTVSASYRILPGSLFRSRQREMTKSFIRLFSKWLGEPEFASVAQRRIAEQWWYLTQLEPQHRWRYARAALEADRSLRSYVKLLLLTLGIPFARLSWVSGLSRRLRSPGGRARGRAEPHRAKARTASITVSTSSSAR